MGWDALCTAIADTLRNDGGLSAVSVVDGPVDQITADLTLMVYPLECTWTEETLDGSLPRGDVRIALHKKASATAAGGTGTDVLALRPYLDAIPAALAAAKANHFGGRIVAAGGEGTPWLRAERPSPDNVNGLNTMSVRFALNVTLPEVTAT